MATSRQRDFPTEWTLWREEDEERVLDKQLGWGSAQEPAAASVADGDRALPRRQEFPTERAQEPG